MKNKQKSRGFGDTVAKLTHFTGIDKLADRVAKAMGKEDCGCERRREKLNEIIPYNKNKGHETGQIREAEDQAGGIQA